MSFQAGQMLGDYEVLEILGAGGMGKVYKVRNTISSRIEAAKVLLPDLANSPELADRFLREIRVTATLDHPNIAKLHTALRLDNQLLMIMEFVEGTTLEQVIDKGRLTYQQAAGYITQVLSALAFAHSRGVVHRDIKPANMMLTAGGVVKLMDFGIAKMAADRKLTQTGHTMGSLYYMSPEQIRGEANLDGRSDLYSVGISLYEMVTGEKPFEADSQYSIMAAHLNEAPRPPLERDPTLPPALNEIIMMAIAKDPAQRFQKAEAFRQALASMVPTAADQRAEAIAAPPRAAAAPPPVRAPEPPPVTPVRRGPVRLWYMLAGSVATIALLAVVVTQAPKWFRTSAGHEESPAAMQQQPPEPSSHEFAVQPPASERQQPDTGVAAAPGEPAEPVTAPVTAPRSEPAAARPSLVTQPPARVTEPPARPAPPEPMPPPARPAARSETQASEPPVSPPSRQPQQATDAAALGELRDQMMMLAARIGPVRSSIDNLRRSQQAAGLGLRNDIASAEQRLIYAMDEAEAAIGRGDVEAAKKYLNMSRLNLGTLDKFLGR